MSSLFQLVAEYRSLQQLDIEEIDERTLLDTLEGLGGNIEIKATNVALYLKSIEALAYAAKEASRQLAERSGRMQEKAESMRDYLQSCLEAAQITKIESAEITLAIKKNPPALTISATDQIPYSYMVQPPAPPPAPDRAAIKKAILAGEQVPGCYVTHGQRLDVRI